MNEAMIFGCLLILLIAYLRYVNSCENKETMQDWEDKQW